MRKITFILFSLVFYGPIVFSQERVETKLISASTSEETKLLETLKNYKVAEIDIAQFKKNVSSLEETSVIWEIDESLKLDFKMYPHDVRSSSYEAITVDGGIVFD